LFSIASFQLTSTDPASRVGSQWRDEVLQGRCLAADIDEDPVVPLAATHRHQAVFAGIEPVHLVHLMTAEVRRGEQPAVQIVGPGVIGAGEQPQAPARLNEQGVAAMPAGVVESPHLALLVAHQKKGMARHRNRVPGLRDLVPATDKQPGLGQPAVVFQPEKVLVGIGHRRQAAVQAGLTQDARLGLGAHEIAERHAHCPHLHTIDVTPSRDSQTAAAGCASQPTLSKDVAGSESVAVRLRATRRHPARSRRTGQVIPYRRQGGL
jgi:hypothetical protein